MSPYLTSSACSLATSARTWPMAARMPSGVVTGCLLSHRVQPVHDPVAAPAAEVVVQPRVLGVQPVVAVGGRLLGPVDALTPAAHRVARCPDVGVGAGRDGGVDGRAERRALGAD